MKAFLLLVVVVGVLVGGFGSSAGADSWCGTPHGTVVISGMSCALGRDITDRAYSVGASGSEVGFWVDGQAVECWRDYSGGWYFLCVPYPNGGYVYWYI